MTTHLSTHNFGLQSEEKVGGNITEIKHHDSTAVVSNNQTLKKQLDENSELDINQELHVNTAEGIIDDSCDLKGPG